MNKTHLYFTIGFPRSGKSTLAKKWQARENNIIFNKFIDANSHIQVKSYPEYPRVVITPDAWRLAMGHRYNGYTEPLVFAHVQLAIRAMLMAGYDVLVDDTHTTEASLFKLFQESPNATYIHVDTPASVCIERAHKTRQGDLEPVIKKQEINLQQLKLKYGSIEQACKQISEEALSHLGRGVITHE